MVFKLAGTGNHFVPVGQVCGEKVSKRIGKGRRLDQNLPDERAVSRN
jgi:hypothetical protein